MSITAYYNALSGMQAQQLSLDTLANNLSNVDTIGYKRKETVFQDMLVRQLDQPEAFKLGGRLTPLGFPAGSGSRPEMTLMNSAQGPPKVTGQTWDVMIDGRGYFEVQREGDGQDVRRFTRDGSLKLSPVDQSTADLTTAQGDLVLDDMGNQIQVPLNRQIRIDESGNIYSTNPNFPQDGEQLVARLSLVDVKSPQALKWAGDNQYTLQDANPLTLDQMVTYLTDKGRPATKIKQGFLEGSNVDTAKEMTGVIEAQRAYQLNARALLSSDQMLSLANNMRR